MPDTPKLSPQERQAAAIKLEMRVRNFSSDQTRTASRAWPNQFARIGQALADLISPDADDETFHTAVNDLAEGTTQYFRDVPYHGGEDLSKMTASQRLARANEWATKKK
jgi:hypothetical protein